MLERDPHGVVLGSMEGMKYRNAQWSLAPGDMLYLYTDGVPEANNEKSELFGEKRMMDALERSRQVLEENGRAEKTNLELFLRTVRSHIDDFVGDTPQFDDLTMMCLEYRRSGSN